MTNVSSGKQRLKILIVEDEAIIAAELADTLMPDYEILGPVASGEDAVQHAKRNRPDLILMDIRIQGELNGIETAIIIQGHYEDPIPVVFLTAMLAKQFPVLAAVEPFIYVNKPIVEPELRSALDKAAAKIPRR